MTVQNIKIRDPRDNYETVLHPETSADVVQYDDEGIGLEAGNVQEAIEELSKNRVTIGEEKPEDGSLWFKIPWWERSEYLATDEDFEFIESSHAPNIYNINNSNVRGYFHYRGSKERIVVPYKIMENEVRDYYAMFECNGHATKKIGAVAGDNGVPVVAIYSDNENVTDMSVMFLFSQATTLDLSNFNTREVTNMRSMFYDSQATTLDLSGFNTSKVTNMGAMFYGSQATTLDLSNFNTREVTNMGDMFYGSQATTLDLSGFNISKVTNMGDMFSYSQATVGYARTQADADRFNASSGKPSGLTFIVK